MSDEPVESETSNTTLYYIVGALIIVAIAAGMYMLRPQQGPATSTTTPVALQPVPLPTKPTSPISTLACELQYYNPVIGYPKYYLSVEGADTPGVKSITCDFSVSVAGKSVATANSKATLRDAPERNGQVFNCGTQALELDKNVPTKVDVLVKDDKDASVTCSKIYQLP